MNFTENRNSPACRQPGNYREEKVSIFLFSHLYCVPRGDGPLPEVGAILGQPVRKTKQALYIPRSTKIEEQLVPEGTYQLLH